MLFNRKTFSLRNFLNGCRIIWRYELSEKTPLNVPQRLRALRYGFLSNSWVQYGFSEKPDPDYLPDFPHHLFAKRINRDQAVFINKILFPAMYGGLLKIPRNVFLYHAGSVIPLAKDYANDHSFAAILAYCRTTRSMIWKPLDGAGGNHVHLVIWTPDAGFTIDGRKATEADLESFARLRNQFIVCERLVQNNYASEIYPRTLNTIRVHTMIDPDTGRAFVSRAIHRFGTEASFPVDNWAAGGIASPIELSSGTLGSATSAPLQGKLRWRDDHPDTRTQIKGTTIPLWKEILETLLQATEAYSRISHCGWDVVVADDTFYVLEGNNQPTLTLMQISGGVLKNTKSRRFYESHDVIRAH